MKRPHDLRGRVAASTGRCVSAFAEARFMKRVHDPRAPDVEISNRVSALAEVRW